MSVTNTRTSIHNKKYEALLWKRKDDLARKLNLRLDDVTVEHEPDDEGDMATRNFAKDLAVVTMERERKELAEVERALIRIKKGEYGICEMCENPIREARLQALPWARLCIQCADRGANMNAAAD
ncbi:MAG TPA: TraR/DksA C4-type zinc finger protein [Candidatus Acidoferrales bacterium]|nr:TraR/DksA C4-type zinc finger protein [Candidatus Acidoferrales bacterium]